MDKKKAANGKVMRLHLQMNLENADIEVLKKYGKVKDGITRDILVPSSMTLHALHYAIQKAFGWKNEHVHSFRFEDGVFMNLTEGLYSNWGELCGVYFRFPDDENDDLLWDDDYDHKSDFDQWISKKYCGPYSFRGWTDHLIPSSLELEDFEDANAMVHVPPTYADYLSKKDPKGRDVSLEDATVKDIALAMGLNSATACDLLESLTLGEVLTPGSASVCFTDDAIAALRKAAGESFEANVDEYDSVLDKMEELTDEAVYSEGERARNFERIFEDELLPLFDKSDVEAVAVTDCLDYFYDPNDNWHVKVTCVEQWDCSGVVGETVVESGAKGVGESVAVGEAVSETVAKSVAVDLRPVCIGLDGLSVMDDVGGIDGYCNYLMAINGKDKLSVYESSKDALEWGKDMGWCDSLAQPEKLL